MSQPSIDGRAARRHASQRRIADAAVHLFAEHGYTGTSVDDIAAAARVSKGTVFYNFTSKAGLFAALLRQAAESLAAHVVEAREGLTGWDALDAATLSLVRWVDQSPAHAQVLMTELFRRERPWIDQLAETREVLLRPVVEILAEVAAERIASGKTTHEPDAREVRAVAISVIGALFFSTLDRDAFEIDRTLEAVHAGLMVSISGLRA